MNAYPLMLLFLAAALARWARVSRAGRGIATGLLAGWVAAGILVGGTVFSVYRSPIETPRGRLLVPPSEAEYANRILAYTATQGPERKIFFARADSLFYFLSGRRMPTPFDLILPGLFLPGDDQRMAESLSQVDQVIYNPTMLPSIPAPITDYLPRSSATLASRFRIAKMLHPTSLLMMRTREPDSRRRTRVDFWEAFPDLRPLAGTAHGRHGTGPERSRSPGKTSWLVYRVITLSARRDPPWSCFGFSDRVRAGDVISVLPMSDPREWRPGGAAGGGSLLFEVYQQPLSGDPALLSSRRQPIHGLPEPLRIPLRNLAGRRLELQFCARLGPDAPPRPRPAGWGELRIVNEGLVLPPVAKPVSRAAPGRDR